MRKTIARVLALLCAALLCSCGTQSDSQTGVTATPLLTVAQEARTLRFTVDEKLPASVLAQADAFADRVAAQSENLLQIVVTTAPLDHNAVKKGETDFALLRNLQMAQADDLFTMLTMPYFYNDPAHMSAALNSESVLGVLRGHLEPSKIVPLAAMYSGSNYLATTAHELRKPADYKGLVVALRTDSAVKLEIFQAMGATVLPYTQSTVTSLLGTQVEILPADAHTPSGLLKPDEIVKVDTVEVTLEQALQLLPDPSTLYLIKTYHTITPLWLISRAGVMESLTAREDAILREGIAGLVGEIELERQRREDALLLEIEAQGIAVVDVKRTRLALANWIYGAKGTGTDRYTPPAGFDPRLYTMLQKFA